MSTRDLPLYPGDTRLGSITWSGDGGETGSTFNNLVESSDVVNASLASFRTGGSDTNTDWRRFRGEISLAGETSVDIRLAASVVCAGVGAEFGLFLIGTGGGISLQISNTSFGDYPRVFVRTHTDVDDQGTIQSPGASIAPGNTGLIWMRMTYDLSLTEANFYYSIDGTNWVSVRPSQSADLTSLVSGGPVLYINSQSGNRNIVNMRITNFEILTS